MRRPFRDIRIRKWDRYWRPSIFASISEDTREGQNISISTFDEDPVKCFDTSGYVLDDGSYLITGYPFSDSVDVKHDGDIKPDQDLLLDRLWA